MTAGEPVRLAIDHPRTLTTAIFDDEGVRLVFPHECAWREVLAEFADPDRFTTAMYQAHVAGKPRRSGARAALEVPDAARKQKRLEEPNSARRVAAFPDALRFVRAVAELGWPMAVASSSKNANAMMRPIRPDADHSLLDIFSANACGRELWQDKPNPETFLATATELRVGPAGSCEIEVASAGSEAACAGGMAALGVARLWDAALLQAAGADLVVTSLDKVAVDALAGGRLCRWPT